MKCKQCTTEFIVTANQQKFYDRFDVPTPTLCPYCSKVRQLAWRNERFFYLRKCDMCQVDMVSCFSAEVTHPVYCNNCWWSDKFDPTDYGLEYDFSRPFFEQFKELLDKTPVGNLFMATSENSEYKSKLWKLDWQHNLFLHKTNTLTIGVEYQQEQGESVYNGLFSSIFPLRKAHTTGFYLQDQIRVASQFFATVGVRIDKHSQFGIATTFRIAQAYFIEHTGTKFKATYGTGFKAPSLFQLYDSFYGYEDLEPEKSIGWDLGIEQQIIKGKILIAATYFSNQYENLIKWSGQGLTNIDNAESKGTELIIRAQIKPL